MLALVMFLFNVAPGEPSSLRIWGGKDAGPNEFPYVVSIGTIMNKATDSTETFRHFCTGSLIAPAWTLTAGHCVKNRTSSYKIVIRYTMDDKMAHYEVLHMVAHQNIVLEWDSGNDIGLLKNEEVKRAACAKLSAVDYTTLIGLEALTAGYGLVNTSTGWAVAQSANKTLQLLEVTFVKCFDRYASMPAVCTAARCGAGGGTRPGDSGGPVIHASGVVAVHSMMFWYRGTQMFQRNAGFAVPVSPYFSWMLEQMRLGSV